ncbi:hypothetical protein SAMN05216588_12631 [Pseudomonas flavescens]|uniref:Uncharacterized protein n=1 Tax=Phytopseudomonas flavescens TaxID=29435 RepID=A0A1G8NVF6_9GAMM|nr:hypothetical protein [Pseudomonas flavescens]SDI84199.1 hypothetical protein SAMN05216588_12631 [Pseudomonas flavescens]
MADKWLEREVAQGLMGLIALRLDGAPAADSVTQTMDIWLVALSKGRYWEEEQDAERFKQAFSTLFATCDRWPAPARLLREMPARKGLPALPKPELTDTQRTNGRRQLADLIASLKPRLKQTKEQHQ